LPPTATLSRFCSRRRGHALGHAHPRLIEALTEQANKVWHVSNLYRIPKPSASPTIV